MTASVTYLTIIHFTYYQTENLRNNIDKYSFVHNKKLCNEVKYTLNFTLFFLQALLTQSSLNISLTLYHNYWKQLLQARDLKWICQEPFSYMVGGRCAEPYCSLALMLAKGQQTPYGSRLWTASSTATSMNHDHLTDCSQIPKNLVPY